MRPFLAHRGWEPRSKEGLDSGSVGVEGLAARGKPRVGAPGGNSRSGAGAVAARARDRDGTRPTVATEMSHRGCEKLTHRAVPFHTAPSCPLLRTGPHSAQPADQEHPVPRYSAPLLACSAP